MNTMNFLKFVLSISLGISIGIRILAEVKSVNGHCLEHTIVIESLQLEFGMGIGGEGQLPQSSLISHPGHLVLCIHPVKPGEPKVEMFPTKS
jgi:hypothetical protein